jgi:predicted adenylyl cyclase CyaB
VNRLNIEIKARCADQPRVREVLRAYKARLVGTDHQIDTYFNVSSGRLKLREGNIENCLVFYEREDVEGPKESKVSLFKIEPATPLKEILVKSLGVRVIVDKTREIYFIDNVKFHVDVVRDLGTFVEIEVIDADGSADKGRLLQQCTAYLQLLGIEERDLLARSYSDLLLEKAAGGPVVSLSPAHAALAARAKPP